jgi:hypothetical protein
MNNLNLEHLKSQAKDLLKAWKSQDPSALARCASLREQNLTSVQWLLARELGFSSWADLKTDIAMQELSRLETQALVGSFVDLVLGRGYSRPKRELARRLLAKSPRLVEEGPGVAALSGRADLLEGWLSRDPTLSRSLAFDRQIPILSAAAAGIGEEPETLACLRLLLSHGADPNVTHTEAPYGDSPLAPLYYAVGVAGCVSAARLLLEAGANPNDNESMYHAMEHDKPELTEVLVEFGAKWEGTNALARLLDYEAPDRLRRALDLGADPTMESPLGGVVHWALKRGRSMTILKMLVERGAPLGRTSQMPLSACQFAAVLGRVDFVEWLEAQGKGEALGPKEQFLAACAKGDTEEAARLKEEHGFVPAEFASHERAMIATWAQTGQLEGVRTAAQMGWPLDAPGDWGGSAANQAAFNGDYRILRLLMELGASWTEQNGYGGDVWGSIYWASSNIPEPGEPGRHVKCAQVLLDAGSPIPAMLGGGEDVKAFLEDWIETHPSWPRADLS